MRAWPAAIALLLALPAAAAPLDAPQGEWREQSHAIPLPGGEVLRARACRPPGEEARPLALLTHDDPAVTPATRRSSSSIASVEIFCWSNEARFFLDRGMAVIAVVRRGFAPSGGRRNALGPGCPEDGAAGLARAEAADLAVALAYGRSLPGVAPAGTVLAGVGSGGWALLGLLGLPEATGIAAAIVAAPFAPRSAAMPDAGCAPEPLAAAAGRLAAGAAAPVLWLQVEGERRGGGQGRAAATAWAAAARAPLRFEALPPPDPRGVPTAYQLINRLDDRPVPAGAAAARFLDGLR
ncbi:hypothetical protein [Neoroseomonas oryzicola]|uniref:Prolyl oligopeptidase family serine peptidase n=1 Tax=Neoroseomonas oryzicola TaxID=535904 RepID=A0A9X9WN39_9PROT|nr:hypothetical protein [Neoroseomonas oryzicola]MBR0661749.1 hypothetical protein [Neoroseomonas oryzicola]NKE17329.1 hypothetical protein [Neoroseomonas oryzicola]